MNSRRTAVLGHRGIYRSSSGNYEIAYRASDTDRLIHHVCDGVCGIGIAAAERANAEIRALHKRGVLRDCVTSVASAADAWRLDEEARVAAGIIKQDTLRRYRQGLDQLLPLLDPPKHGGRPGRNRLLRDVFPHTVAGLIDRLDAQGVTPPSRDLAISSLRNLLERAVVSGELGYNAVDEFRRAAREA